jgi:hypothetical protein
MAANKTYVLGEIEGLEIDKPFTLKWAVKSDKEIPSGSTNVFEDTAYTGGSSIADIMPLGETISSTAPTGGGPGELGDTTF